MTITKCHIEADIRLPEATIVRAGELTAMYERGTIRYMSVGGIEIVCMVYAALRLPDWDTLMPEITAEKIEQRNDSFSIQYVAVYHNGTVHYEAAVVIEGFADNRIVFSMNGNSLSAFETNRIGLCLHHTPAAMRNVDIVCRTVDESEKKIVFPEEVSPRQLASDLTSLAWRSLNGFDVRVAMSGETFEIEDQRNWGDGSFKTYSPPLMHPYLRKVTAGESLSQQIEVSATQSRQSHAIATMPPHAAAHTAVSASVKSSGSTSVSSPTNAAGPSAEKLSVSTKFPALGLGWPDKQYNLNDDQLRGLKELDFDFYTVWLNMADPASGAAFSTCAAQIENLGARIRLTVLFSNEAEKDCEELVRWTERCSSIIDCILVLSENSNTSSTHLMTRVYPFIKQRFPLIKIGYGTAANFAELNRNRPADVPFDYLQFGLNPQVHAFDERTILESLAAHRDIIRTVKLFAANSPVVVSPLSFNSVYTECRSDKRNHSWFQLYWYLQSMSALNGAEGIGFFSLDSEEGFFQSRDFRNTPFFRTMLDLRMFGPQYIVNNYGGTEQGHSDITFKNSAGDLLCFRAPVEYSDYQA
jgi:D-apionolactonase